VQLRENTREDHQLEKEELRLPPRHCGEYSSMADAATLLVLTPELDADLPQLLSDRILSSRHSFSMCSSAS
jgi:hypothetical protein